MATEAFSFTPAGTGNRTILLNGVFTPTWFEFEMGPRSGTDETRIQRSSGWTDMTRKRCISEFDDGTVKLTRETTTSPMRHFKNSGGAAAVATEFTMVSAGAGQFTINVSTLDNAYTVSGKCGT